MSSYKLEKFKSLKERQFKYDKNVQTDSVSNFIADLHVELIYLYHKIGLRLLDFLPPDKRPIPKGYVKNVDRECENMVNECKRNKIAESLLLLNKALHLHNSKSNNQGDQKSLVEVIKISEPNRLKTYNYINFFNKNIRVHIRNL